MNILVRTYAFLTRKPLVWLKDSTVVGGEATLTFARTTPFGMTAPRYPGYSIREVTLNPDGTTSGCGYVEAWKYDKATQP